VQKQNPAYEKKELIAKCTLNVIQLNVDTTERTHALNGKENKS